MNCAVILILNKKNIKINSELMTIYKVDEVCVALKDNNIYIPITGKHIGEKIGDYGELIAYPPSIITAFKKRSYKLDDISNFFSGKYYLSENKNDGLIKVSDNAIIKEADKLFNVMNNQKEFSEESMNNESDISIMYKDIKKTIISQDEQIMKILTSLFKNQRVINSSLSDDMIGKLKENILIAGPTGTGKTEILTRISKSYNVPIVIADSTSLSETGYRGINVEDLLRDLYLSANNNIEVAQKGILVIDEFDKLAEKSNQEMVSRSGVQRSLLKLLDGSTFYLDNMTFDTSKLTIVGLGAFSGIKEKDNYVDITTEDLVKYGVMQELIGRFSKVIKMNSLSKEDLKKILVDSNLSPINTYKKFFDEFDVDFSYDDSFIDYIATKAEVFCIK